MLKFRHLMVRLRVSQESLLGWFGLVWVGLGWVGFLDEVA